VNPMKVLVANRGEIAVRILRACRDAGVIGVAIYAESDRRALHTRCADEAVLIEASMPVETTGPVKTAGPVKTTGPVKITGGRTLSGAASYMNIPAVVAAAKRCGADAIHPGYGFLSENASFAQAVESAGLTFVGPRAETLARAGDKLAARRIAQEVGIPVLTTPVSITGAPVNITGAPVNITGTPVSITGADEVLPADLPPTFGADLVGQHHLSYPLLVKAVAGGGGRGIRLVQDAEGLAEAVAAARREALAAFGDGGVYLEPYLSPARHIEVQILGDGTGRILCLGERECSIQRRRQKLIEESPAPRLSEVQRTRLFEAATRLGAALRYRSLGTVEFLMAPDDRFYFIEINPRIQVEHPVTEMVTGMDLVIAQLELAAGEELRYRQDDVAVRGAAIEARVIAEDPENHFFPTTGEITYLKEPGGPGVRVDSALYQGMEVTADYDSLLAKVITWGESRDSAIRRLSRALTEFKVGGVVTDLAFLKQILSDARFVSGDVHTTFLDTFEPASVLKESPALTRDIAAAAAFLAHREHQQRRRAKAGSGAVGDAWRTAAWREQM
jgi:acetyl-CoA carboxylase, biotin carboxylase subunit